MDFKGPVDQVLTERLAQAQKSRASWKGLIPSPPATPATPLIALDAELERLPLALLEAEITRLQQLVSIDRTTAEKFSALSKRIVEEGEADRRGGRQASCQ
jgi:hypothetical protein